MNPITSHLIKASGMILGLLVVWMACVFSTAEAANHPLHIYLDGKEIKFGFTPYLSEGKVMVPIKQFGESLEANVTWDSEKHTVTVLKDDKRFTFPISQLLIDDQELIMEAPTKEENGVIFVPIRDVSEALGCQVGWEEQTDTVVVSCTTKKKVKVISVIDGLTLIVDWDGTEKRIHLLGVLSWERATVKHKDVVRKTVLDFVQERVDNKEVWVELSNHPEKYNMPADTIEAFVYDSSGNMLNIALLDKGFVGSGHYAGERWQSLFDDVGTKVFHRKIGFNLPGYLELWNTQSDYVKILSADLANGLIRIKNTDEMPNDIGGWTLSNARGDRSFTFPTGFILGGLAQVGVVSGNWAKRVESSSQWSHGALMIVWSTDPIWNPKEDTAILYDSDGYEICRFEHH
jgi:hypothetical protein